MVYRCVKGHVNDDYQGDNTRVLISFISCLRSLQEIENDSTLEQYTLFSIRTSTGKLIDKYGGIPNEIILLPGSCFQIVNRDNNSHVRKIELDEIVIESIQEQEMEIRQRKQNYQREPQQEIVNDVSQTITNDINQANVPRINNTTTPTTVNY